jgi:hypothetical protein
LRLGSASNAVPQRLSNTARSAALRARFSGSRCNGPDVKRFVESLRNKAAMPDALRVVIVDNGSRQTETRAILEAIAATKWAEVIPLDEPFNWSRLNNLAVERDQFVFVGFC